MSLDQLVSRMPASESPMTLLMAHFYRHPRHRQAFHDSLTQLEALLFQYDWRLSARKSQRPPLDPRTGQPKVGWHVWCIMGGRGMGKTRPGAEQCRTWAEQLGAGGRIALVAKDPHDARTVMVEGESGILACSPPWFRPLYEPSKKQLRWPNDCLGHIYSSEDPGELRGPQHHKAWGDELCKWKHAQDTWDNLQFGLRLGEDPQCVITTTPRPIFTLKDILKDPGTIVTRGSTYENRANLPEKFLAYVLRKYEGTRLGRQELHAEMLEDTPGALWTLEMIEQTRVKEPPCPMITLILGVDPAVSAPEDPDMVDSGISETGIVAVGKGEDGHGYVHCDVSGQYSPGAWGNKVCGHYQSLSADYVVGEVNNGGDLVEHNVLMAARDLGFEVMFKKVTASRGKRTRAEPVAALYEQKRMHHVGMYPELEDEMTTWVPGEKSPDRMDALVWAATEALILSPDELIFR